MTNEEYEEAKKNVTFSCRFHPTDWFHEIGCPHMEWTNEQLLDVVRGLKVNLNEAHKKFYGESGVVFHETKT